VEPGSAPWRVLEASEPEGPPDPHPAARGLPWPAIIVAVFAVLVAVGTILVARTDEPVIGVDGAAGFDDPTSDAGGASTAPALEITIVVDVGGAVARPGVYRLPAGSRVADAVDAAGGYAATVDASLVDRQLNLATPVTDGQKIRVPVRGEAPQTGGTDPGDGVAGDGAAGGGVGSAGPVDLNRASAEVLDTLPGVGPVTAAKIIAARDAQPFTSVDDLLARKVVGSATLEKLRPLVTIGP
jgi:competence protein ComEA